MADVSMVGVPLGAVHEAFQPAPCQDEIEWTMLSLQTAPAGPQTLL